MGSYLEAYDAGSARRTRIVRWLLLSTFLVLVIGTFGYFKLRDYREDRVVKNFLAALQRGEHQAAYSFWGCDVKNPCPQYPYNEFLKDWGPEARGTNVNAAHLAGSKSCESGVIEFVRQPGKEDALLWVDRKAKSLSFVPWQLKPIPPGFKHRFQSWMWEVTRNCKPLIEP
jgi:hypothetical protein